MMRNDSGVFFRGKRIAGKRFEGFSRFSSCQFGALHSIRVGMAGQTAKCLGRIKSPVSKDMIAVGSPAAVRSFEIFRRSGQTGNGGQCEEQRDGCIHLWGR